jgi:hypothetical protein
LKSLKNVVLANVSYRNLQSLNTVQVDIVGDSMEVLTFRRD